MADGDQERSSKEVYDHVLETLEKQTGGPEQDVPAAASERHLRTTLCSHGDLAPDQLKAALRRAIENDDVFCYQRHDGYYFVLRETEALLDLVATWRGARHAQSADDLLVKLIEAVGGAEDFAEADRQEIIAAANEARQALAATD